MAKLPPMGDARGRPMTRREFFDLSVKAGVVGGSLLLPTLVQRAAVAVPLAPKKDRQSEVVRWNDAFLQGVRESRLGPPMVARALAVCHTCVFDAWVPYDRLAVATRPGGPPRPPANERTLANKTKPVSFGAYRARVDLF